MMMQATQKRHQLAVIAVRLVAVGIVVGLLLGGIASAVSATSSRGDHLFPDLKIGFNIRW